jgi:hypothetical protein
MRYKVSKSVEPFGETKENINEKKSQKLKCHVSSERPSARIQTNVSTFGYLPDIINRFKFHVARKTGLNSAGGPMVKASRP